jgi:DNA-binding MarR family transcriptional regulator
MVKGPHYHDAPARGAAQEEDADAARVMDALRRLVHALHVASRASERDLGVSAAQLFVLREVARAPGQSLSQLARSTRTAQSSVSEVVARLVKRGLIVRHRSLTDRRRATLALTAEGNALLQRAPETVQVRLVTGLALLGNRQRRDLADAMEAWLGWADLADAPATFFFEPTGGE